jgi:hypothetical protein
MTRNQKKTIENAMVNLEAVVKLSKPNEGLNEKNVRTTVSNASYALRELKEVFPQQAKRLGNS